MNRSEYFNFIEEKLSTLATRIEARGKLNILDFHLHSENFYLHFFNSLFGWKLQNLNASIQNVEAIDLIDYDNKIIIQVSATASKEKVGSALTKDLSAYAGYTFKFISISKDAAALRNKTFTNPHNIIFDPQTDIYDLVSILKVISALNIDDLKRIHEFINKELGVEADPSKHAQIVLPQSEMKSEDKIKKRQLEALLKHMKNKEQKEISFYGDPKTETIVDIARLEAELEGL